MENMIIIGILLVVVVIALRSTVKHFKGEGGCCGGGSEVRIKKKLKHVEKKKTVRIEGMHCENCKNRVESRLNELAGVSASVNLKAKTAIVSMEKEVSNEKLREVITKAGYEVVEII